MEHEWKKSGNKLQPLLSSKRLSPSYTADNNHAGVMKLILLGSLAAGIVVKLLPCEYDDGGNPVPNIIFKGLPSMFRAFVISIMLAFAGAFSALLSSGRSQFSNYEKFCRFYSLLFGALAIAILGQASITWISQGMQIN